MIPTFGHLSQSFNQVAAAYHLPLTCLGRRLYQITMLENGQAKGFYRILENSR